MVKKPRVLPDSKVSASSKKSPSGVADDEKKWSDIYHQQALLRKEKEEVGLVKLPANHKSAPQKKQKHMINI